MSAPSLPTRGGGFVEDNGKTSFSSAQAAAQLTRTGTRWLPSNNVSTVTYAFRDSGTPPVDGGATFSRFSAVQISATELAMKGWSDVANIVFQRVYAADGSAYSSNATILFGDYVPNTDDGAAGFASFPGNRAASSGAGDVWIEQSVSTNTNPVVGDYGAQTLAHEIGHSIGLSHPSEYNADVDTDITYSGSASYYEDSRQYSIMSYFGSTNVGGTLGAFAAAPQIDDIAAAQRLYGGNYATRAGDTTYGFNSNADRPWFIATDARTPLVFAVWDGGGRDRFDFSGYSQNQFIDLREGAFSNVGGWVHNVSIAYGVTIEEAIGGSGNDALIGNDAANGLDGGSGNDTLYGGLGADMLTGRGGNDEFNGSLAELNGDRITDLSIGDRIHVSGANFAGFSFQHIGGALTLAGGATVGLDAGIAARLVIVQSGDGIDLLAANRYTALNDFNGDGHSDLLWRNTSGAFSLWSVSGNVQGTTVQQNTYFNSSVGIDWQIRETFDWNGDGVSDILWRQDGGAISVWNGTGSAFNVAYYNGGGAPTDWNIAAAGDFNGDGKDDVLWRQSGGAISVWQSQGSGFLQNTYYNGSVGNQWFLAGAGDFNGDGKDDLLWRNQSAGQFATWTSDGGSFASAALDGSLGSEWQVAGVGDFNGDGKDDILFRNSSGTIYQMQSTGSGFSPVYSNASVGNDWSIVQIGDFNDDGKADILWRNQNGAVSTWESNGNGFTVSVYNGGAPTNWQIEGHDYHL